MSIQNRVKVVTLGDAGVGKSSIVLRMREKKPTVDTYQQPETTIGIDYSFIQVPVTENQGLAVSNEWIDTKNSMLGIEIWDTAGQERYQAIVNSYLRNGHIFLIVFDCTNEDSFVNVQKWLDRALQVRPGSSVIILGNKIDLAKNNDHPDLYRDTGVEILYISARTTENWAKFRELLKETCLKAYPNAITHYCYTKEHGNQNSLQVVRKPDLVSDGKVCWC